MHSETEQLQLEPISYPSWEAKAALWPRRVVPQIIARANEAAQGAEWRALAAWLAARGLEADGDPTVARLAALHNAIRAGRYKDDPSGLDIVYPVALAREVGRQGVTIQPTIEQGGDCDDWAPVLLAALLHWRLPARIVAIGTEKDPYAHVFIRARLAGTYYTLDAKGNQQGFPFDHSAPRALYPLQSTFAWHWKNGALEISQERRP